MGYWAFFICVCGFSFLNEALGVSSIVLSLTHPVRLDLRPQSIVRVQRKSILRVKDYGTQIALIGKKIGETQLQVGRKLYNVYVISQKRYRTWNQLKKWIQGRRGPEIYLDSKNLMIRGRFLILGDFVSLENYTDEHSDFSIQSVFPHPLEGEIRSHLRGLLTDHNLVPGGFNFSPVLSLAVDSKEEKKKSFYKKLLVPFGVQVRFDTSLFSDRPLVKIQLHIAHIKKSFLRTWGLSWPKNFSAQVPSLTEIPLEVTLESLESQGWGKVLASPVLTVQSGQKAHFHSGGEFPVQNSRGFSGSVQWKPYGLLLRVKPEVNAQGHIKISIETELSAMDPSVSAHGVVGVVKNQMTTTVGLKKTRPLILSGLIEQKRGQNRGGLPWLSQIPLLAPLFSSQMIYDTRYDLVFILDPQIVSEPF